MTALAYAQPTPCFAPPRFAPQTTRDALVLENLPLARAMAVRVFESLPVHVDLDDLTHSGVMGLFDAASKYDADKCISFPVYAKHRIRGAILDSLRGLDWASRGLRKRHKQLEELTRQWADTDEGRPSEREIAELMGMSVDRWRQVAVDLRMIGLLAASTRAHQRENQPPDFPAGDELNPALLAGQRQLKAVLALAVRELPQRYRQVIEEIYSREKTLKEIASLMGVNESRVCQIHRAALEKLGSTLQAAGIRSPECVL